MAKLPKTPTVGQWQRILNQQDVVATTLAYNKTSLECSQWFGEHVHDPDYKETALQVMAKLRKAEADYSNAIKAATKAVMEEPAVT